MAADSGPSVARLCWLCEDRHSTERHANLLRSLSDKQVQQAIGRLRKDRLTGKDREDAHDSEQ